MQPRAASPRLPLVAVGIAACLYAAAAAREVQLLPAGEFAARDGRPGPGQVWRLDDAGGRALAARLNARKTPLVIDYEHQTINASDNGQPAPAAAWASQFEWRDGVGLFAVDVEWTARARQMIEAGEYRFISPVIAFDKATGEVRDVFNAALVNFPALEGMAEVAQRLSAHFAQPGEESSMTLLAKLLAALGLPAETTEESALTALAKAKADADETAKLRGEMAAAQAELSALKAKGSAPDATTVETMKALQKQVTDLQATLAARDLEDVIKAALAAGKLVPAQEKWARELGGKDLAALKTYLETAPAVAALGGSQTRGRESAGGADATALADRARAYQDEQAKLGRTVSAAAAVAHVSKAA